MSAIMPFSYEGAQIRTLVRDGEPWWVARDVCAVLGLSNITEAVRGLDDDEKGVTTADTLGGPQQVKIVNESGLYSLIMRSRRPEARAFRRWVTHEVLPAIRRTGAYGMAAPEPLSALDAKVKMETLAVAVDSGMIDHDTASAIARRLLGLDGEFTTVEAVAIAEIPAPDIDMYAVVARYPDGITATEAAAEIFDEHPPTAAHREVARRRLNAMSRRGELTCFSVAHYPRGGLRPVVYRRDG